MRLRLLKSVVVTGHPGVKVGDVFEEKAWAGYLLSCKYAEEVKDEPAEIVTREPEIEHRDPAPKKSKRA